MKETIQIEKLLSEYAPLMARIAATFEANKSLQDELIQEMSLAVWRAFEGASKGSDSGFRGEASENVCGQSSAQQGGRSRD